MKENLKRHQVTINDLKFVTPDVFELSLQFTDIFFFQPGQYVWLILPNYYPVKNGGGRRAFSITSAPNAKNEITLVIRNNKDSVYKKSLSQMSVGDQLFIEGPFGKGFTISENTTFITDGVAIAPFLSLVRTIKDNQLNYQIHLLSLHHPSDHLLYENELKAVAASNPNFHYSTAFIEKKDDELNKLVRNDPHQTWYLLGSENVLESVHHFLLWNGVKSEDINFGQHYPHEPHNIYLTTADLKSDSGLSFYKYMVDQSANHIIVTDIDGCILYANMAAEQLTGYSFEEMYGQTPRLWGGLMSDDFYVQFWKTIKIDKLPFRGEITNRKKNGTAYRAVATVTPIFNEAQKLIAFVGIEEDITEHLNIERDLKRKTSEIEKLNKLMIGRELKMVELKKQIKQLKEMSHE